MAEILDIFLHEEWAIRALIASSMVGLMCGVLGCFIVLRNMALIGDALAHAILPGVVVAFMIVGYSALGFFTGAVVAGLLTAVGITWIQHNVNTKNDAAIGIVFTAMFSLGIMGISWISRDQGVHLDLKDFLFGNVLGVSNQDLYLTAGITVYVLISIVVFYRYLFVTTFQSVIAETMGISTNAVHYFLMLLLSFAVVASLQTVGVILVVAMLITPAATALLLSDRLRWVLFIAGCIGLTASVLGMVFAVVFTTTPGPAMAVTATLIYMIAVFLAPKKGLVFRFFQKRKLQVKIELEDTLKQSLRLQESSNLNFENLMQKLGFSKNKLNKYLNILRQKGHAKVEGQKIILTPSGIENASQLVRAHRLWETYLVQQMGLTEEQIHEEAEKFEHLLSVDLLDEVDERLGFPSVDPHGSPIPAKKGVPDFPLIKLKLEQFAKIAQQQVSDHISSQLWQLGLLPETSFSIKKKDEDFIEIEMENKKLRLPKGLARKINIVKV